MTSDNVLVAVFNHHAAAESAVKRLADSGFDMKKLSIVGKGYHTEEKVVGFYNAGDRVKLWGKWGAFWGGLWGLFFGGVLLTIPVVGHLVVLGHLASLVLGAVEGATIVGGLSALGAALYSIGIPKDSVLQYETDVKQDGFLVVARGSPDDVARVRALLEAEAPARLDVHEAVGRHEAHAV